MHVASHTLHITPSPHPPQTPQSDLQASATVVCHPDRSVTLVFEADDLVNTQFVPIPPNFFFNIDYEVCLQPHTRWHMHCKSVLLCLPTQCDLHILAAHIHIAHSATSHAPPHTPPTQCVNPTTNATCAPQVDKFTYDSITNASPRLQDAIEQCTGNATQLITTTGALLGSGALAGMGALWASQTFPGSTVSCITFDSAWSHVKADQAFVQVFLKAVDFVRNAPKPASFYSGAQQISSTCVCRGLWGVGVGWYGVRWWYTVNWCYATWGELVVYSDVVSLYMYQVSMYTHSTTHTHHYTPFAFYADTQIHSHPLSLAHTSTHTRSPLHTHPPTPPLLYPPPGAGALIPGSPCTLGSVLCKVEPYVELSCLLYNPTLLAQEYPEVIVLSDGFNRAAIMWYAWSGVGGGHCVCVCCVYGCWHVYFPTLLQYHHVFPIHHHHKHPPLTHTIPHLPPTPHPHPPTQV